MASDAKITLTSKGKKAVFSLLEAKKIFDNAARHGLLLVGKKVLKEARDGIKNPPKSGFFYKIRGRRHKASAPGQYPANTTGQLRRSVNFKVIGKDKMIFGAIAKHGLFMEKGTRFIEPRPFLARAAKDTEKEAAIIMKKALSEEIERSATRR